MEFRGSKLRACGVGGKLPYIHWLVPSDLYAYVGNDPLNLVDPSGDFSQQDAAEWLRGSALKANIVGGALAGAPCLPCKGLGFTYFGYGTLAQAGANLLQPQLQQTIVGSLADIATDRLSVAPQAQPLVSEMLSNAANYVVTEASAPTIMPSTDRTAVTGPPTSGSTAVDTIEGWTLTSLPK